MNKSFEKWLDTDAGQEVAESASLGSPRVDPVHFEKMFLQKLELAFLSGALLWESE